MGLSNKRYDQEDITRAEARGRRIGLIEGVEELENRLSVDLKDDEKTIEAIKNTALKLKRSIERRSLLK